MLNGKKISYVCILDNQSKTPENMKIIIWHYYQLIRGLLKEEHCIIGRKTQEITSWKGPKTWVFTRSKNWNRVDIQILHSIKDIEKINSDKIYILGGTTIFDKFKNYVDEIHMYVINSDIGNEKFPKLNLSEWKSISSEYIDEKIWSYAHLVKQ